jgi:hypothetical protein
MASSPNPLAELEAWWSGKDDEYDSGTRPLHLQEEGEALWIEFETVYLEDARARWRLGIEGCVDHVWCGKAGRMEWAAEHALLAPFRDRYAWISFSGPLAAPLAALNRLVKAHARVLCGWVHLDQYFRLPMLGERFGILAQGPETILAEYAKALEETGCDVMLGIGTPPYEPFEQPQPTGVVTWGDSYFVARGFTLERIA